MSEAEKVTRMDEFIGRTKTTTRMTFDRANVKQALVNGFRMTVLSTIGVVTTNFLNAYMTTHGMQGRVFSVTLQPNPLQSPSVNPLKRTTSGF
jgi:hypothetical protein